jgi:hypothetical protein
MEEFKLTIETRQMLTKELVEHYLKQAEQKLEYIVNISNQTTEKGYKLLSLLIAILTGFGWVLSRGQDGTYLFVSIVGIAASAICCGILLTKVVSYHTIWSNGRTPEEMDINVFPNYYINECDLSPEKAYIECIADEIESIQEKVDLNLKQYKDRIYFYKACLDIMVYAFVLCSFILIWSSLTP